MKHKFRHYISLIKAIIDKTLYSEGNGGVLARGAVGAFAIEVAGTGILFALHILVARLLGAGQYGIYTYTLTCINILAVFCLLGFHTSLVRFISEYNIKNQWGLLRGILRRSRQYVLCFSLIVSLIGIIVVRALSSQITNEMLITFYFSFALLPFVAFCRLCEASLRAFKKIVQSKSLMRIIRPVLMGLIVIIFLLLIDDKLKARHIMAAHLASVIFVTLIGAFFLHKHLPEKIRGTKPVFCSTKWLKVSLPLLLVASMHIVLKRTDIVMLGALKGSEQAGIYSVASRIADIVIFALLSINSILAPMFSEMYHTGQKQQLQKTIKIAAWIIFVFTLGVSILLIIFGKSILSLFGLEFTTAFVPLLILLFGQIVNSLSGSVGLMISMSGRQNILGLIISSSAVANILFNFLLIPFFGMTGAAISTAVTMIIRNIIMLIYVRTQLGINPTIIGSWKSA